MHSLSTVSLLIFTVTLLVFHFLSLSLNLFQMIAALTTHEESPLEEKQQKHDAEAGSRDDNS